MVERHDGHLSVFTLQSFLKLKSFSFLSFGLSLIDAQLQAHEKEALDSQRKEIAEINQKLIKLTEFYFG